jgi:hypothetical protein
VKTQYYLDEIDVSQLPLPVREQLDKGYKGSPYKMIGFAPNWLEPRLYEKTGEYYTFWTLFTTDDGIGSFTVMKSPWVSPRIDKYLENILITKEGDL